MEDPNALERAVLGKLFDGDHPALISLRRHAELAKVASRKLTGAGFYTSFELPEGLAAASVPSAKIHLRGRYRQHDGVQLRLGRARTAHARDARR